MGSMPWRAQSLHSLSPGTRIKRWRTRANWAFLFSSHSSLQACARVLRPKGRLVLIHRADRIDEVLRVFPRGFGGLALRFVHSRADCAATRVLVSARKGSRAPLSVAPPLILHEDARFTQEAGAMHRGEAMP